MFRSVAVLRAKQTISTPSRGLEGFGEKPAGKTRGRGDRCNGEQQVASFNLQAQSTVSVRRSEASRLPLLPFSSLFVCGGTMQSRVGAKVSISTEMYMDPEHQHIVIIMMIINCVKITPLSCQSPPSSIPLKSPSPISQISPCLGIYIQ